MHPTNVNENNPAAKKAAEKSGVDNEIETSLPSKAMNYRIFPQKIWITRPKNEAEHSAPKGGMNQILSFFKGKTNHWPQKSW